MGTFILIGTTHNGLQNNLRFNARPLKGRKLEYKTCLRPFLKFLTTYRYFFSFKFRPFLVLLLVVHRVFPFLNHINDILVL